MTALTASPGGAAAPPRATDPALQQALESLQATAAAFAQTSIHEARVRAQYARDVQAMSREYVEAVRTGRLSARQAATEVQALRNHILDLARLRSSPTGRAYATRLKREGRTLAELVERYAQRDFQRAFATLAPGEQATVWLRIVEAGGRPDPHVVALARRVGRAGRRVAVVSLAVAVWEIHEAEDRPREVGRQGVLAGAGIAGGWLAGAGAVSAGVCAATAPVCVGVAALAGALLVSFGADEAFEAIFPRPTRR